MIKSQNKERTQKFKNKGVEDDRWGSSMAPALESALDLDLDLDQLLITWKKWRIKNEYKDSVSILSCLVLVVST